MKEGESTLIKLIKKASFYEISFDKLQEVVPLLDELSYTQYKSDDAIPYGYLLSTKEKKVRVPASIGDFEIRKRLKNVVSLIMTIRLYHLNLAQVIHSKLKLNQNRI